MKKFYKYLPILTALVLLGCKEPQKVSLEIIPQPVSAMSDGGVSTISSLSTITSPEEFASQAKIIAGLLSSKVQCSYVSGAAAITIINDGAIATQGYSLVVDNGKVTLSASDIEGVINGGQTLRQLLLTADGATIPNLVIEDAPRFSYRGLMIDCSRHFWTVDEIKKSIDNMSLFKLNKLHLHLTDNNAWRMAMDKYPELTEAGTYYKDFPELSGKFYTKDDLKNIVAYATERGIEVIPEVDLPGHATALMAALPNLSCNGGKFEAYPEEMDLKLRKRGNENMICIGNPQSLEFVEDVVNALVEIFPSKYIHLGGDEVPTHVWEKCPKCQALYKEKGMTEPGHIQDHFTREVAKIIRAKGKKMIGWDEIDDRAVATKDDVVMVWRNTGVEQQLKALERDIPVIMTPQHGCYFDWGYAGNSVRKVYDWDPISSEVPSEKSYLVMGAQACIWTERVPTQERMEWMLYPRVAALSEVMWSDKSLRNWDNFYARIIGFYPIFEQLGITYYDDASLNAKDFAPSAQKPALVRHAQIDTNIPVGENYHAEYAFDGMTNSFFWGALTIGPEHYFTLVLGEPTQVNKIKVITGDSKDYITIADLLVSTDGTKFEKVAEFDSLGEANAEIGGKTIKAIKIQVTGQHTCWPVIKEIIVE